MQYRKDYKSHHDLSIIGFGCMRLPSTLGRIDMNKTEKLLLQAYHSGVNYFDTAYIYPGSEEAVGNVFAKHQLREKIFLATKLPQMLCKSNADFDMYFNTHKKRLQTEYIDYYLIHNISEYKQWERLCALGIKEWLANKKDSGEIRQIGFSFHGSQNDFLLMLDAYDWDFVQIQYNYININYQAGMIGLKKAHEKGLPVIIMEPLLGGKLATGLPQKAIQVMQQADPNSSPVSWALRWLWNQPEVTVVLSGMNEMPQLEENISLASSSLPNMFSDKEEQTINDVIKIFNDSYKVRCTGCNYCMPCPKNINIPGCFSAYNHSYSMGWRSGEMLYLNVVGVLDDDPNFASTCISCGKCETHCPQGIQIRKELKAVKRRFEIPGIHVARKIAKRVMK